MACCSERCKQISAFSVSTLFIIFSLLIIFLWDNLYTTIFNEELTISTTSKGFQMWKETPIPMYLAIYLYNWTNHKEVLSNWNVKPKFIECGPYVYKEHHSRVNLEWLNNSVIYQQNRTWVYQPALSNGSLDDEISNLNVIAATVAHAVKDKNIIVRRAVDFLMREKERSLIVKKTVREWIFDGYEDELLNLLQKLNISALNIPFDRFGWFFARNGSASYDGNFTMFTGTDDIELLGIIDKWNGNQRTPFYNNYCADVNGTSGELWPPVAKYKSVSIFSPDICSTIEITQTNNTPYTNGLMGKEFAATEKLFDNGTKYPSMGCFNGARIFPSGVRDVSKCKFGAPAFVSFPHFYLADPIYRTYIDGMNPNASKHQFVMSLEPTTGIPLDVKAQLQLNIYLERVTGIQMFEKVRNLMVPMLWFRQSATLTSDYASQVKVLLVLPSVALYTGYGLLLIGLFILCISAIITCRRAWKEPDTEELLSEKSL